MAPDVLDGGELVDAEGVKRDIRQRLFSFDGTREHGSLRFKGEDRYSLVFFPHPDAAALGPDDAKLLEDWGFNAATVLKPISEVSVAPEETSDEEPDGSNA